MARVSCLVVATVSPLVTPPNNTMRFAHEAAAIRAIQTIQTMQVQFDSQYGRFATSLTELGLAAGEKSGYKFTMTGNQSGYQISAVRVAYGNTGSRTFYSDQAMAMRENDGPEPATARSKEMK